MSSLASQLAGIKASNNASVLDRKKRKKIHSVSLIYDAKVAATQDYNGIFYMALDALRELELLDPRFEAFENSLFSDTSIEVDRLVQTAEQNQALDRAVDAFLSLIAPRINLQPAVKTLEWLVRRFQIHIHNADSFLLTVLPYYSSAIFLRVLDVLPLPLPPIFSFLTNSKKTAESPSRNLIIRALSSDAQLYELVSTHIVKQITNGRDYNTLLAFWSSISIWCLAFMKESNVTDEDIIGKFLPSLSSIIALKKNNDAQVAAYMILAVLGSQTRISQNVFVSAIQSIVYNWSKASSKSGLSCITQLVQGQEGPAQVLPKDTWDAIDKIKTIDQDLVTMSEKFRIDKFVVSWIISLQTYAPERFSTIQKVISSVPLTDSETKEIIISTIRLATQPSTSADLKSKISNLFEFWFGESASELIVIEALKELDMNVEILELALLSSFNRSAASANQYTENFDEAAALDKFNILNEENGQTRDSVKAEVDAALDGLSAVSYLSRESDVEFFKLADLYTRAVSFRLDLTKFSQSTAFVKDAYISFLARIWSGSYAVLARIAALQQFDQILADITDDTIDLQAFIPYILIGLTDSSEKVRRLAGKSVATLAQRYPIKKAKSWGVNILYGPENASSDVTWISSDEVRELLNNIITPRIEECVLDNTFIYQIIGNVLDASKKEVKSSFCVSLLSFFTSHALSVQIPQPKAIFLRFVNSASKTTVARSKLLSYILESWVEARSKWEATCEEFKFDLSVLETEVVDIVSFGEKSQGIRFFEECLKLNNLYLSRLVCNRIIAIWETLKADVQLGLVRFLVDLSVDDKNDYDVLDVLNSVSISSDIFVTLLKDSKLEGTDDTSSPNPSAIAKRRRRSSASSRQAFKRDNAIADIAERHIRKVTTVLELLERSKPEPRSDLLPQLFTILGEILSLGTESNLPVLYTEQVLANCMLAVVAELKKQKDVKLDSNAIRVDIIVSCIRASSSPQVQNRFLLLVASLAELAPEIVLHSVMPIFTFMGANTIRQDDEFSSHVIQQTISRVIPALLVDNQNGRNSEEIEFLLLSFVTAFSHIPRHRRVKLFTTLAKTLGAEYSLHILLNMLGQKYSEAKSKKKSVESRTLQQFSDTFMRGFSVIDQTAAIQKYLTLFNAIPFEAIAKDTESEFTRGQIFGSAVTNMSSEELVQLKADLLEFISSIIGGEDVISGIQSLRIRIISSIKKGEQDEISAIREQTSKSILLLLGIIDVVGTNEQQRITSQVFATLDNILDLLPISDFIDVLKEILNTPQDVVIKRRVLSLLRSKFELELSSDEKSQEAAKLSTEILSAVIKANDDASLSQLALDGLDIIVAKFGSSFDPKDLKALLDLTVAECGLGNGAYEVFVPAVSCINSLCAILGARSIGHFAKIVPVAFARFEDAVCNPETPGADLVQLAVISLIAGLIKRIPAFMNSSIVKIINLVLKSTVMEAPRKQLLNLIITNIDLKIVLSALTTTWSNAVNQSLDAIFLHLDALDAAIELSERKVVSSQSANLVKFLLESFEVRGRVDDKYDNNSINRIETRCIKVGIQIILKLNDKTFRPLFVSMVRWAIDGAGCDASIEKSDRLLVFFKFFGKLLDGLRSIVTNYYGYLIDPVSNLLDQYSQGGIKDNEPLRRVILNSLYTSFQFDHDEFWQSRQRFEKISASLLAQMPTVEASLGKNLVKTIVAMSETCASEDNHKTINELVLSHMKDSCSSNQKLWAIRTLKGIYLKLGEEWLTMLPQLVPVIAELLEDEDEKVEMEVRRELVPVIEEVLGEPLERYLS
ncbi:hypothetical protein NADFUDRAFT_53059 [Nadsonia fulvescens var. elongata DSM 6958]|uniref:U3 small nucleolar RNA-associated protein 10 n=1 Tax=Nadsonia fulvescens var. elongata DSM 6958 TaxID=857566 RepID=A0A1E3PFJ2_9ASCO|nr:hypothetical protein NADFUDRAFT_53059 [Nadsonia fulvescens var. elongata DSM 6958]